MHSVYIYIYTCIHARAMHYLTYREKRPFSPVFFSPRTAADTCMHKKGKKEKNENFFPVVLESRISLCVSLPSLNVFPFPPRLTSRLLALSWSIILPYNQIKSTNQPTGRARSETWKREETAGLSESGCGVWVQERVYGGGDVEGKERVEGEPYIRLWRQ